MVRNFNRRGAHYKSHQKSLAYFIHLAISFFFTKRQSQTGVWHNDLFELYPNCNDKFYKTTSNYTLAYANYRFVLFGATPEPYACHIPIDFYAVKVTNCVLHGRVFHAQLRADLRLLRYLLKPSTLGFYQKNCASL